MEKRKVSSFLVFFKKESHNLSICVGSILIGQNKSRLPDNGIDGLDFCFLFRKFPSAEKIHLSVKKKTKVVLVFFGGSGELFFLGQNSAVLQSISIFRETKI